MKSIRLVTMGWIIPPIELLISWFALDEAQFHALRLLNKVFTLANPSYTRGIKLLGKTVVLLWHQHNIFNTIKHNLNTCLFISAKYYLVHRIKMFLDCHPKLAKSVELNENINPGWCQILGMPDRLKRHSQLFPSHAIQYKLYCMNHI